MEVSMEWGVVWSGVSMECGDSMDCGDSMEWG